MNMSHYANRVIERNRAFEDLEWEMEERAIARRTRQLVASRPAVNLSADIDRYLERLAS